MKRYPIRAAKYVLQLIIILTLTVGLLIATGYSKVTISDLVHSDNMWMMLVAVIILALAYPFMGYSKKTLVFDANKRVEDVDRVMAMCGYAKVSETGDTKIYRASHVSKKVLLMFEDTITITTTNEVSVMDGPRKEIVKIYFRMGTFIA